ncbi:GNAT family N-acetyltransferase [Hyalangium rubrum]|uniref:GNAT family N-acetyltransferase n=1 Tax=Hyalangium rubrum TaxID=3103134 RepID=A0ABU5H608_9BACT|nr:GNAT family N-acetyltransferase [Hyalangium sp. s54d21]MDY7228562.1 GNAT family N-acetyltransferase [Hyalangium sp. s54d21]
MTEPAPPRLVFHEVTAKRWPDFVRLFERRGGPKNCWCMVWRAKGAESRKTDKVSRKAAMARRVRGGVPVGLLGYVEDEPMAWCSIAPRDTYRPLGGPEEPSDPEAVWSIACFFIHRELRGQGVMQQLLDAAIAHAKARGASILEAYPVDPDSPSYRFMGFVSTFREAGFREVGLAGTRRHVMRLKL